MSMICFYSILTVLTVVYDYSGRVFLALLKLSTKWGITSLFPGSFFLSGKSEIHVNNHRFSKQILYSHRQRGESHNVSWLLYGYELEPSKSSHAAKFVGSWLHRVHTSEDNR